MCSWLVWKCVSYKEETKKVFFFLPITCFNYTYLDTEIDFNLQEPYYLSHSKMLS